MQTLSPTIAFGYVINDMTIESISNNVSERSDSNGRRHQCSASNKLHHRDLFFLLYGESRDGA
eukprot:scaffold91415_cov61-Attheya_sp.AAC.6